MSPPRQTKSTFEMLNDAIFNNQFLLSTDELKELKQTIDSIVDARE